MKSRIAAIFLTQTGFIFLSLFLSQSPSLANAQEARNIRPENPIAAITCSCTDHPEEKKETCPHHRNRSFNRIAIRDFVLYNYDHLADNIINGKGLYLETLYGLLGIPAEEKGSCLKRITNDLILHETIPGFSTCVAAYATKG